MTTPLPAMRRKAVTVSEQTLVREALADARHDLPLVITPGDAGIDLSDWAARHREALERKLLRHGALLFRDFAIRTIGQFEQVIAALSGGALEY
nr:TauD/TfdA family dioxygenase [Pseudomonadota bacterium]